MADNYLLALTNTLLRHVMRQNPGLDQNKTRQCLEKLISEWDSFENVGGLCIEQEINDETTDFVNQLKSLGIVSMVDEFSMRLAPQYFEVPRPFVLDDRSDNKYRIYIHRTFLQEALLAHSLIELAADKTPVAEDTEKTLKKFREHSAELKIDDIQLKAIEKALSNRLSIISGGPGTGKTSTVKRILEAELASDKKPLIYVTAPTGKAKNRLFESIKESPVCKDYAENQRRLLANTIHMWLSTPTSTGSRPDANNPLDCDILVIDETSMVDSEIAFSLFNVIDPRRTKVIILGDMHQLAAVGPGAVYADISDQNGALKDNITELTKSFRFKDEEGIGKLAKAIKEPAKNSTEHCQAVWDALKEDHVEYHPISNASSADAKKWLTSHLSKYIAAVKKHLCKENVQPEDLQAVWEVFSSFRAIAAMRNGPGSVEDINRFCEDWLCRELAIAEKDKNYPGKPIIIRNNDLSLEVANGDDGFLYKPNSTGSWQVYIGESGKSVPESLLSEYDTAYAITIHQSQGSGFDDVSVFLPNSVEEENQANLATRELLYTAVTRAKENCAIFGSKDAVEKCVKTKTKRSGGLAVRLKNFKKNLENS